MAVLETLVKILLALGVVAFVAYPFLQERLGTDEEVELPEETEELYRRKESTYSALKELEFDYKTGKLSESDFKELDAKYRAEAIEVLAALDELEKAEGRPGVRARPVAPARGSQPAAAASKAGRAGPSALEQEEGVCAECGVDNPAGAKFCRSCGQALPADKPRARRAKPAPADEPACDECGALLDPAHKFCADCGAAARPAPVEAEV